KKYPNRILTFLAKKTPPGREDYSEVSSTYFLEEGVPEIFSTPLSESLLNIDYYYNPIDTMKGDSIGDGFNKIFDCNRNIYGVKLRNACLEFYLSLVPNPRLYTEIDYTGSVTSILLKDAPNNYPETYDNMLSPFSVSDNKLWGQISKFVLFPPPWQVEWFYENILLGTNYQIVYSNSGLMRTIVTLKSIPFTVKYKGLPFFGSETVDVTCSLYRMIYVYPEKPYYMEELVVLAENGYPISFRPYYFSRLHYREPVYKYFARLENIPDYFAEWRHIAHLYYGYGFASTSHVRGIERNQNEILWRLPLNFNHKTIHYFMFNDYCDHGAGGRRDLYHTIGHNAWYERLFKPISTIPVQKLSIAKRYTPDISWCETYNDHIKTLP
ncbi:MAG: hypothetical protein WCP46_09790, partial [Alphaproteobacteria bacterium]